MTFDSFEKQQKEVEEAISRDKETFSESNCRKWSTPNHPLPSMFNLEVHREISNCLCTILITHYNNFSCGLPKDENAQNRFRDRSTFYSCQFHMLSIQSNQGKPEHHNLRIALYLHYLQ